MVVATPNNSSTHHNLGASLIIAVHGIKRVKQTEIE